MGLINCVSRKQFNVLIKSYTDENHCTWKQQQKAQPHQRGASKTLGKGLCFLPWAECLDLRVFCRIWSVIKCPEVKESRRHCRLFKAKCSRCFYEIQDLLGHILQSRGSS